MKMNHLFLLELKRLLQSRLTWLVAFLTILSPLIGLFIYEPASGSTMSSVYLANPSIAGGVAASILFGLLSIFEMNRAARSKVDVLMNSVVSPLHMALLRLLALMATMLLVLGLTMLIWLPISRILIGSVFYSIDYILSYSILMGLAIPLGILASVSSYQFTQRVDLSVVFFAVFIGLSLTIWSEKWQLCWLNPCVWALSDDFSNHLIFRSVAYMRLTWFLFLAGVWILSWLCIRQYGKNLIRSLMHSAKRIYHPAIAALLLFCAGMAYVTQPFVDHSNPDQTIMSFNEFPIVEDVICTGRTVQLFPNTTPGNLTGNSVYQLRNTSGQKQQIAFAINPGYKISQIQANGTDIPFSIGNYQEYNEAKLEVTIPASKNVKLMIRYSGLPKEDYNISYGQGGKEISSKYLCLENATLSPRLLNISSDEETDLAVIEITLPDTMTVIPFESSDAKIVAKHENGTATWRYKTSATNPILYAGDYIKENIQTQSIPIQFYYGRKHQSIMKSTDATNVVKNVVDYCTENYGNLSFDTGDSLKLIQSRISDGGYAGNGASLLDEPDFTATNLADNSKGATPSEVMIHEMVHQWWGLGVMFDGEDDTDPWSAEGLTVYTSYRIAKEQHGAAYAKKYYVSKWQQEVDNYYSNFYIKHPDYFNKLPENKQIEVSAGLSTVRQYSEMPLKILKAEKLVGGEEAMDKILSDLFNQELDPEYPYLTYQDFLDACGLTEEDLNHA